MEGQKRVLGVPVPFEHDGRRFEITPWTLAQEGQFAAWVEQRAVSRLVALRTELGEDEFRAQMRDLRRDIDAGLYEWGSEIVSSAWNAPTGQRHLVHMTLASADRSVTRAYVDELFRNKTAWKHLWKEILLPLNFPPEPAPEVKAEPEAGSQN